MNTNEAVEKLIAAGKKLLREDLHASLDAMFKELYSPLQELPLAKKPFYHYTCQYCPSETDVPAVKEMGKIYWFIDKEGAVQYQVLISQDPMQLHKGQLETNIIIPVPELRYVQKQVTTEEMGVTRKKIIKQRVAAVYTISNDEFKQTKSIKIDDNDDDNAIKEKVRTDYLKQTMKRPLIVSLEGKILTALKKQKFLAKNEADFSALIEPRYQEIVRIEKDITKFVTELIPILEDESFKAIFIDNSEALDLIAQILKIAKEIQSSQEGMLVLLEQKINNSTQAIGQIEQARQQCNEKNYQIMAALMASLDEIIKKPESLNKVKFFVDSKNGSSIQPTVGSPTGSTASFFLSVAGLSTGFSAQLVLRRQMTLKTFIESFTTVHPQIGVLATVYNGLLQTNNIINRMQAIEEKRIGNEQARTTLKLNLSTGNLRGICFQLVIQVSELLIESMEPSLKKEDWDKTIEKRKRIIISYLKQLEKVIEISQLMKATDLDPAVVSVVINSIENNKSITLHDIIIAITGLINAFNNNPANLELRGLREIMFVEEEDYTPLPISLEKIDTPLNAASSSTVSDVTSASSSSPRFFHPPMPLDANNGSTVPTPAAAQNSTEKSDGKKPSPENNGKAQILIDELTGSTLFKTRMGRS